MQAREVSAREGETTAPPVSLSRAGGGWGGPPQTKSGTTRHVKLRMTAVALLLAMAACGAPERPVSVLLITLDTTRADRIGCYGYPDAGTPTIDALAARGAVFGRALAPVPITLPSHTSLMTGSYPPYHGVRDNGLYTVAPELLTLAESFAASGRRTAAFVSAFPLDSAFGLDAGFEVFDDKFSLDEAGRSGLLMERTGAKTAANAALWLSHLDEGESFFSWVHLFDPHYPYEAPEDFQARFPNDPYQAEISAADASIAALLRSLGESGRLSDTVVVVTADHGEGLGEHGEETHALLLYDSTLRVPLVIAGPGVPAVRAPIPSGVSLIDIAPTIANLAGLPEKFEGHGARNLAPLFSLDSAQNLALETSRELYFESVYPRDHNGWSDLVGIEVDGWKYVEAPRALDASDHAIGRELYEMSGDPAEEKNLAESSTKRAQALAARLRVLQGELLPKHSFDAVRELAGEDSANLEALGYTDSVAPSQTSDVSTARDPRQVVEAVTAMEEMRASLANRRFDDAKASQEKVARADPAGVSDFESIGMLAQALGSPGGPGGRADLERALAAYRKASELLPTRRGLLQRQAEVLLLMGEYKEGLITCRRALALAPASTKLLAIEANLKRRLEELLRGHEIRGEHQSAESIRAVLLAQ